MDFSSNSILSEKERSFIWGGIMQIAAHLAQTINCEWREFKVGDIFDIKCSKYHDPKNYNDGKIPYVARTTFDNGVIKYVSTDENLYEANCIIIGAESATAFYQAEPFITGNKIYRLYLKDKFKTKFNKNLALFFCSLINIAGQKYTYANAFVSSKVEVEIIKLPIDKFGNPNFEIMEKFIKDIEKNHTSKLLAYYHKIMANGGGHNQI